MNDWALEARDIHVNFGGFIAIGGVSLRLEAGELRVLIGPNGAGKSTLLDVICGKVAPANGEVLVCGSPISGKSEADIVRAGVGRKFQTPRVFPQLKVWQNLEISKRLSGGSLRDLFRRARRDDVIDAQLELIGLSEWAETMAEELSHGQYQWLELGMLLMQDPEILLLDEPTAGMTIEETRHTGRILKKLRGERTILVVEHDMEFVRDISKRITVMHQGRILVEGTAEEIERDPEVLEVYLGSGSIAS